MVRQECRPVRPQASNTRAHLHGRCRILPIKQVCYVGLALEEHRRTRTRNRSRPSNSLGMAPRIPLDTKRKLVARLVARLQFDGLISEERRRIPGTLNISADRNQGPKSTRRLSSILIDAIGVVSGYSIFKAKINVVAVTAISLAAVAVSVYLSQVVFGSAINSAFVSA